MDKGIYVIDVYVVLKDINVKYQMLYTKILINYHAFINKILYNLSDRTSR
jgi:hypothetical protein